MTLIPLDYAWILVWGSLEFLKIPLSLTIRRQSFSLENLSSRSPTLDPRNYLELILE